MSVPIIAEGMAEVTPNDNADLPRTAFSLYVVGAGNVAFIGANGVKAVVPVAAYSTISCRVKRVLSAGTTATGIYAYLAS